MKINIEIEKADIERVERLIEETKMHPIVIERKNRNINNSKNQIGREKFWRGVLVGLFTSVQKSGAESAVSKFLNLDPHPLSVENCVSSKNMADYVRNECTKFGGIRRYNKIAEQIKYNLELLKNTDWKILNQINQRLPTDNYKIEEEIAGELTSLKGIGSKQSRNIIQNLGLTRFEIPIDSRLMKWINSEISFPIKLTSAGLQDENYYCFVLSAIRKLSSEAGIFPCELDAMIFSTFEKVNK
ncbi:MAG: hypothetical protein KBF82_10990 [Chitinophagaceae bacterium]|nr:hypothetical protein [Chitinophagaceae bacterium]